MVSGEQAIVDQLCKISNDLISLRKLEEEKDKREVDIFFMNIPEDGGARTFTTGITKINFKTGVIVNPNGSTELLEINMGVRDFMHSLNIMTDKDIKIRLDSSKQHTISANNQETIPYITYTNISIECTESTEITLFACTNPSTVLGSFMTVLKGQNGEVAQKATGELISTIQGSEGIDIAQDASGAMVSKIYGDKALVAQDASGRLILNSADTWLFTTDTIANVAAQMSELTFASGIAKSLNDKYGTDDIADIFNEDNYTAAKVAYVMDNSNLIITNLVSIFNEAGLGISKAALILDNSNLSIINTALITEHADLPASRCASLYNESNLTNIRSANIFNDSNLTTTKLISILDDVNISSSKIKSIFETGLLSIDAKRASVLEGDQYTVANAATSCNLNDYTASQFALAFNSVLLTLIKGCAILEHTNLNISNASLILIHSDLSSDREQSLLQETTSHYTTTLVTRLLDIITLNESTVTISTNTDISGSNIYRTLTIDNGVTLTVNSTNLISGVIITQTLINNGTILKSITGAAGSTSGTNRGSAGRIYRFTTDVVGHGGNSTYSTYGGGAREGAAGGTSSGPGGYVTNVTTNPSDLYILLLNGMIDYYITAVSSKSTPSSPQAFINVYGAGGGVGSLHAGGRGGGGLIIVSDEFTNNGLISANGGDGVVGSGRAGGGGSGGQIVIAAITLTNGSGTIRSKGGHALLSNAGNGGGGIVYCLYHSLVSIGTMESPAGTGAGTAADDGVASATQI